MFTKRFPPGGDDRDRGEGRQAGRRPAPPVKPPLHLERFSLPTPNPKAPEFVSTANCDARSGVERGSRGTALLTGT
jgi:hypothetical protein